MVAPLVRHRRIDVLEVAPPGGSAKVVAFSHWTPQFSILSFVRNRADGIHGDGSVTALVPKPDPLGERCAAPAMDQNHRRPFLARRRSVVGEHACRLSLPRYGFEIQGANSRLLGFRIVNARRLREGSDVPWHFRHG